MTIAPPTSWPPVARDVDDLLAVLSASARGGEPADDGSRPLNQLEHGLQCAQLLQLTHPDDVELQVAGLLHDIGHTLAPGAVDLHGQIGAAWVEPLLGERVAALIRLHVPAKRYLVTVDPHYRDRLSAGSVRTLAVQGDELVGTDLDAFESEPHHRAALVLRRADEGAKVAGIDAGRLADWVPPLRTVAGHPG